MMVDLSGYRGKISLLAVMEDCEELGILSLHSDNSEYAHFAASGSGDSCWVDNHGKSSSGDQFVKSVICEVSSGGIVQQQPTTPTDPIQQLLDNLISQNAALTKIIADYMAGRGCN